MASDEAVGQSLALQGPVWFVGEAAEIQEVEGGGKEKSDDILSTSRSRCKGASLPDAPRLFTEA